MIEDADQLAIAAEELRGMLVSIVSSLTLERSVGHDRHFSTRMSFTMNVEHTGVAFSGGTLDLLGKSDCHDASYGIGLHNVVAFKIHGSGAIET